MKTHLLRNVGKGPRQFHQGQTGLSLGGFLLLHRGVTTSTSRLFLFPGGAQGSPFPSILFCLMKGIGVCPLLLGGTGQHFPPLQFSVFLLLGGFLSDELHDTCIIHLGWRVTGPRSTGFGLDLVQPRYPFFTGRYLDGHPFHRTSTLRPLRFKTFSTRNNESSETFTFCTSGS